MYSLELDGIAKILPKIGWDSQYLVTIAISGNNGCLYKIFNDS